MPVKICGKHTKVVEVEGVISIDELVGGVSTKDDSISVAHVKAGAGAEEPWLTMLYDEWLCIISGQCIAKNNKESDDGDVVINAGETAFISNGSTWKPCFPVATEYIAICNPAFRPDRCIREGENNEEGMEKLKEMHSGSSSSSLPSPPTMRERDDDLLYHMTTKAAWEEVVKSGDAYYPPTFVEDGNYTHATAVPARLITTANHFYQDSIGEWICLEFTRSALRRCGIIVRDEEPLPVGDKAIGADWTTWVCPHVYGGIPPAVVHKTYAMIREGKEFKGIEGLA
jgi:hypothetical protein